MDGRKLEPVELVTHYESDHGAATHVHFPSGQLLTVVKPDFEARRWLAFTGTIVGHPFLDTCRAQVEVELRVEARERQPTVLRQSVLGDVEVGQHLVEPGRDPEVRQLGRPRRR